MGKSVTQSLKLKLRDLTSSPEKPAAVLFSSLIFSIIFVPIFTILSTVITVGLLERDVEHPYLEYISYYSVTAFTSTFIIALLLTTVIALLHKSPSFHKYLATPILSLLILLLTSLQGVHLCMYLEYGYGLGADLIGIFHGDAQTIFEFMQDEYNIYSILLVLAATAAALGFISQRFLFTYCSRAPWGLQLSTILICGILALNGYLELRTGRTKRGEGIPTLSEDAYVSATRLFLEFMDLKKDGYKRFLTTVSTSEEATLQTATRWVQGNSDSSKPSLIFNRPSSPPPFQLSNTPSKVFLIQLEGHDGIVMRNPELRHLSPNLNKFAETGIHVPYFFTSSNGTSKSLMAVFSSLPAQSMIPHYKLWQKNVSLMLPHVMHNLGYESVTYSASYYDACLHGEQILAAGMQRFVAYADEYPKSKWDSVWGISDKQFTDNVLKDQLNHKDKSQFVVCMNISNHTPYQANVVADGYDVNLLPKKYYKLFSKGGYDPAIRAGHYWYADKHLGRLVNGLHESHPNSLFIIFTDHHSRYCRHPEDPLNEHLVPFVMWGPDVIPETAIGVKDDWFGSHADIFPTLIALLKNGAVPPQTYGSTLWDQSKNFHGTDCVGNKDLVYIKSKQKLVDFRTGNFVKAPSTEKSLLKWWAGMSALSYKIIRLGDDWNE